MIEQASNRHASGPAAATRAALAERQNPRPLRAPEVHRGVDEVARIEIVRAGGGSLMLSIDGGPVLGAHSRLRPRYQTMLSQPMRYVFDWP